MQKSWRKELGQEEWQQKEKVVVVIAYVSGSVATKARAGLIARLASHVDVNLEPKLREAILPVGQQCHSVNQRQLNQQPNARHHLLV